MRRRARVAGLTCWELEEARSEAGPASHAEKQRQVSAMEPAPAPDLGLGDSSLHRYLDGDFWSLKNELRRLLGGCPLFRQRYRAAAVAPARAPEPAERVPSVPGASLRTPPWRGRGGVCAAPERRAPSSPAGDALSSPGVWAQPAAADFRGSPRGVPLLPSSLVHEESGAGLGPAVTGAVSTETVWLEDRPCLFVEPVS